MVKPVFWSAALLALACDGGQLATNPTGAGGSGVSSPLVGCGDPSAPGELVPAAYANPADFSASATTGAVQEHTLVILRRDVFDRVTDYVTAGPADHQHPLVLTQSQVIGIQANTPLSVTTEPAQGRGPVHTHTLMIHTCGIPGD